MEKADMFFSGIVGFHFALVCYFVLRGSFDILLHSLIFSSGIVGVLIFAISQKAFENKLFFLITLVMVVTVFISSLILSDTFAPSGRIFNWLVMALYNIASTRTMKIVDVSKVAKRNIIINTLILVLNLAYYFS